MKSGIERVFPARNRTALEGSPAREAFESGEHKIQTTFGHVVTKIIEVMTPDGDSVDPTLLTHVLSAWPPDMHAEEIGHGGYHGVLSAVRRILKEMYIFPVEAKGNEMAGHFTKDIQPLLAAATKAPKQCITVGQFCLWLATARFTGLGILSETQRTKLLSEFPSWLQRGYMVEELAGDDVSEETKQELLHVTEVQYLAHALADQCIFDERRKAEKTMKKIIASVEATLVVNDAVRRELFGKLPIQPEH